MKSLSRREFMGKMARQGAAVSIPLMVGGVTSSCASTSTKVYGAVGDWSLRRKGVPEGRIPMEPVKSDIRSQLARISSEKAVYNESKIDPSVVRNMVREGIKALGGTSHVEDGWTKVFPSYKGGQKVGILVNTSQELRTQAEVAAGVVNELIDLGVQPSDIIVWGNARFGAYGWKKMGYQKLMGDRGVILRTNHEPEAGFDPENMAEIPSVDLKLPLSRIVTTECDYLINVPVIKSHSLCGVTGALKLYYAAIPLADALFTFSRGEGVPSGKELRKAIDKVHRHNGDPQIAELAASPLLREKTRLHVGDALLSLYEGGPFGSPQWVNGQILVSQDPVSIDYHAFQIIETKRQEKGVESALLWTKYIQSAAEMGLGTNHPDQIELMDISVT